MVDFLFVGVALCIGFTNAFREDFRVAFLMASVFAIFALHACGILKKFATKCASHDVIELL